MEIVITVFVAGWLLANALATRLVLRDEHAERHQRVFQLLAVWLVPVIGALLAFGLHRKPEESPRKYPDAEELPSDLISSHHIGRATRSISDD